MAEPTLTVVARITARQDKVEQVKQKLTELIAPTRAEPGCIRYVLHQSIDDECSFLFLEEWTSRTALDEHLAKPHLQAFVAASKELLAKPLDITLWHQTAE